MPNEMTAEEIAEKLERISNCRVEYSADGIDFVCDPILFFSAASILRRVDRGELAPVVHGHIVLKHRHMGGYNTINCPECGTEIETQRPVEGDEPYCSVCGAQLAESFQDVCPRCGALMDGKDGTHDT